jgi:Tfp pilus assembly protein PilF
MSESRKFSREDGVIAVALAAVVLVVYWPTVLFQFVAYDDPEYVYANPTVREGLTANSIRAAFTVFQHGNWHPLTTLSHMLDATLFGLNAGGHHATNVLLHALNAVLLFAVLRRLTGARGPSAAAAALFALHPLNVETVAWISSRKDVLSTALGLLAIGAYGAYARRPGLRCYGLVLILFILSLMAKPMLVTLPLLLLTLDWWPLERLPETSWRTTENRRQVARLVAEKVPLLVVSLVFTGIAVVSQRSDQALRSLDEMPFGLRIANALVSCVTYLLKAVWPSDLAVFYPFPTSGIPAWEWMAALAFLVLWTGLVLRVARRRKHLLTGWFWYLVALAPVSGIVQVGGHARADRYAYVPLIGVFVAVAWAINELAGRHRAVAYSATASALGVLAVVAGLQLRTWANTEALFTHAIAAVPDNYRAHYNLGSEMLRQQRVDDSLRHLEEAVRVAPRYVKAYINLGIARGQKGDYAGAEEALRRALELDPRNGDAHFNLANLSAFSGRTDEAISHYRAALGARPDDVDAWLGLGTVLARQGDAEGASRAFAEAARLAPADPRPAQMLKALEASAEPQAP